jgi:hypothetical protein
VSAFQQLGEKLSNALKSGGDGGNSRRPLLIGALAVLVLGVGALYLWPSDPPPAPEGAVLPKKRPVVTAAAANKPADKPADKPASKASDKAPAKAADAAKTVAVPSKPAATVAAKPAPTPPATKAAAPAPSATKAAPSAAPAAANAKAVASAAPPAAAPAATPNQTVSTPRPAESVEPAAGVTIQREVYAYDGARRRDPFVSLAKPADVGPLLNELRLVGIAFDEVGRNSVAVLRDGQKGLYRVKTGQSIGRAKVSSIGRRSVTFSIDEFGATRQEVIALADTTKRGS